MSNHVLVKGVLSLSQFFGVICVGLTVVSVLHIAEEYTQG